MPVTAEWRDAVDRRLANADLPPLRRVEIVEELATALQDRFDELRAAGESEADARRLALGALESERLVVELSRLEPRAPADPPTPGTRRSTRMGNLWQDLRYAARTLHRAPAFCAIIIATLSLGIGANAAIFSVVDAVLLRPYSYPDMERIVLLHERTRSGQDLSVAWPNFQDWRDQNQVFVHLGVYRGLTANLTGGEQPERLSGALASSGVFSAMGLAPSLGRAFGPDEDRPGTPRVAVISERLWRVRFEGDPAIVGRSIVLNGEPHVVVGVMPPGMRFPSRLTDVWLPLGPAIATFPTTRGAHPGLYVVGRLKPGITFDRAVADLDTIAQRLEQQYPDSNRDLTVAMAPYYDEIVRHIRPTLLVLFGAVAFVLLIACANLANLMLARSERREREVAVRRALGADRRRIVQHLLTESLMLALLGGGGGVLLAWWMVTLFVASTPSTIPRIDLVGVGVRVLGFAAGVAVASGILFGLAPALRAATPDLRAALTQTARGSAPARRLRSTLVVAEVALALVLLVGAGLMVRSFTRLMAIDPGFDPDGVATMRLTLPQTKYADRERWLAFHAALVERVTGIPGMVAVGVNSEVPLEGGGSEAPVVVEGRPLPPPGSMATCLFQASSPGYLRAMGIPLLKGRLFTEQDTESAPRVIIVDETLAERLFPGEEPLGRRIAFEFQGDHSNPQLLWREIVGVVRHVRHYDLAGGPPYVQVYAPFAQPPIWFEHRRPAMALVARTNLSVEGLLAAVRREAAALDPDIPLYNVRTMRELLARNTEEARLGLMMLGGLGTLALALALVGIYGVVSYSVAQRTQEIGVRMALGATRRNILRLVVGNVLILLLAGIAIGVAAALAMASAIRAMLFEVSERDPATFAAIAVALTIVGLLAGVLPARRATRIDPLAALHEP